MAVATLDLDFQFEPTWGNYRKLREVFGCDLEELAARMGSDDRRPSEFDCLVYFEVVTGTKYTAMLKPDDVVAHKLLVEIREKMMACISAYLEVNAEYEQLVSDSQEQGVKKK